MLSLSSSLAVLSCFGFGLASSVTTNCTPCASLTTSTPVMTSRPPKSSSPTVSQANDATSTMRPDGFLGPDLAFLFAAATGFLVLLRFGSGPVAAGSLRFLLDGGPIGSKYIGKGEAS